MLQRDIKDPRLRGVTLSDAEISADLRHCRIFFSHLEGSAKAAQARAGFERAAGFIRQHVGRELGLRVVPELIFEFDNSVETAARIDLLLRQSEPKH